MDVLTGYSNCQVCIELIIKDGGIVYTSEPVKRNLQPRNRNHAKSTQSLWSPIRQLQAIGSNIHGLASLSMNIVFDSGNNPLLWTEVEVRKLRCL